MSDVVSKVNTLFNEGYSCSEAVLRAFASENNQSMNIEILTKLATPFSGGMGSGCLCGAIAGAQMYLGLVFGRENLESSPIAKKLAAEFIKEFKAKRKFTCCSALSKDYEFSSPERRNNCKNIVNDSAEILKSILDKNSAMSK